MKGIVFDAVSSIVCENYSITTWDAILRDAGVDGAYSSLGIYPDDELFAIVEATSRVLDIPPDDVLRWVGAHAFGRLATAIPEAISSIRSWDQLLMSLDAIVHAEVTRMHPDAITPGFAARRDGDGIVLSYSSARGLCTLAEGLIVGAGRWYGSTLVVEHLTCALRGDPSCELRVSEQFA